MFHTDMLTPAVKDFDFPMQAVPCVEPLTLIRSPPLLPVDKSKVLEVVQYARVRSRNHTGV